MIINKRIFNNNNNKIRTKINLKVIKIIIRIAIMITKAKLMKIQLII